MRQYNFIYCFQIFIVISKLLASYETKRNLNGQHGKMKKGYLLLKIKSNI